MKNLKYLNVPGLYNSGPAHWQTHWENLYADSFSRVQQDEWDSPVKTDWVHTLQRFVNQVDSPTILIAHSLGCITTVHWSTQYYSPFIKGLLLVAPADLENSFKENLKTFAPVPTGKLEIPSVVVASLNDPYCSISRAASWAAYWGSRFVSVGSRGHINADSNLGNWDEGLSLLRELEHSIGQRQFRFAS